MKDNFYVTLSSSASPNFFPKNTLSNFSVVIPPIYLESEKYGCCLTNISFENNFQILVKNKSRFFSWKYNNNVPISLELPLKIYANVYDIVFEINKLIIEKDKQIAIRNKSYRNPIFLECINNIITFKQNIIETKPIIHQTLVFNDELCQYLGLVFNKEYVNGENGDNITKMYINNHILQITSNIIDYEYVNNKKLPLLRQIGVDRRLDEYIYIAFDNFYYKSVKVDDINVITISIVDSVGNIVELDGGETVVTLHFKTI